MRFDRDKLVRQRQRLGYSQETLASLANVGVRTVQRAEAGEAVRRENMADLAAALRLPLHALLAVEDEPEPAQQAERVSLRRAGSGREIIDLVEVCRLARLECDADPTAETMPALTETIELIEPRLPDPWRDPPAFASLADRLRAIAALDAALEKLAQHGLAVFIGRRFEQAVMPRDYDEGYLIPRGAKPGRRAGRSRCSAATARPKLERGSAIHRRAPAATGRRNDRCRRRHSRRRSSPRPARAEGRRRFPRRAS